MSPEIDRLRGAYVERGQAIGLVATLDRLKIRAVAEQDVAGRLKDEARPQVTMRVASRPDLQVPGRIETFLPAGRRQLPSPALGFAAGGPIATRPDDESGTETAERVFEIHIRPEAAGEVRLLVGQRVVVRFTTPSKPLLVQGWRALLQTLQRRFQI